ncbi:FRG domain-containing protein [Vibrio chagasii]|nr:FRG domain-containing protein [Vibrio chagasii]
MMLDFYREIDRVIKDDLGVGYYSALFRGHSNSDYKLLPTILRGDNFEKERSYFYDYKSYSTNLNGKKYNNWDTLIDMQHYGAPTRLLDWTESLGVAIYFALLGDLNNPCIWALDPFKLNEISTGQPILYDISDVQDLGCNDGTASNYKFILNNIFAGVGTVEHPFAFRPNHIHSRIAAQKGLFTCHTNNHDPIEVSCPEAVRKILIPAELIQELKIHLRMFSLDEYSLFPDKQGLANWLAHKHST